MGLDGTRGETGPGDDGELGALGEEPPFGLLVELVLVELVLVEPVLVESVVVESVVVELEVSSEPCENVPRLLACSRVSSRAWLLKTRRAVGAATPLAVPLPPPDADRPARGAASERDVDFESRAASAELLPAADNVEGDEWGIP